MRSTEPSWNMRGKGGTKKFHICWVTKGGFKALQCKQTQTNLSFLLVASSNQKQYMSDF